MGWELGFGGGVVEVVAHMGEEGTARFQLIYQGYRLIEVRVAGMRVAAEGIEDEYVEILEERDALGWDVAHVGEIGSVAEAVAGDLLAAVGDRDSAKTCTEEIDACSGCWVDAVNLDLGAGGVAIFFAEGVLEDALEAACGGVVGVDGHVAFDAEAEGAQVVEAEDVIGVTVGVEYGVDVTDVFADGLRVEVGAGVDEDGVVVVVEADGGAGSAIARVSVWRDGGSADGAVAAEGRHPHGGAGAEEGEGRLHR